ncbi:MAG TPA: imidazole glycerol phosphate synthase subunit HisH [bacterium]
MITVVDYGMGNLRSVQKAMEHLGFKCIVTSRRIDIDSASHIIVPGVGAFRDAMKRLEDLSLTDCLRENVKKGKPFLGICLGMQILFEESTEFGRYRGLGILRGRVVRFFESLGSSASALKVPHMGWNRVNIIKENLLIASQNNNRFFYFVHSYYVDPAERAIVAGETEYGINFASFIANGNVFATQFHPEKSQQYGLEILKRFGELK